MSGKRTRADASPPKGSTSRVGNVVPGTPANTARDPRPVVEEGQPAKRARAVPTTRDGNWLLHRRDPKDPSSVWKIEAAPGVKAGMIAKGESVITADMTRLEHVDISVDKFDPSKTWGKDWLPKAVAGNIEVLKAKRSKLQVVPGEMSALEELDLAGCRELTGAPLPESSAKNLRKLDVSGSFNDEKTALKLPAGMKALETLKIMHRTLSKDFLPESSGKKIKVLDANYSTNLKLPPGMAALEELDVSGCISLDDEWLPPSSGKRVRQLQAVSSQLQRLPKGMLKLEDLDVTECRRLDRDFLPTSSAKKLRKLRGKDSSIQVLPENMDELVELDLTKCDKLEKDFLPASSCNNFRVFKAN